jgi:hypothetical protein
MTRVAIAVSLIAFISILGCQKEKSPSQEPDPNVIKWDKKEKSETVQKAAADEELEWEMPGVSADLILAKYTNAVTGNITKTKILWNKMAAYKDSHLKAWKDALIEAPASETDVLDAFNELAFAVTGPGGFWRRTLPQKWLGCTANPDLPPCLKLKELDPKLGKWDKVQKKIGKLPVRRAKRFLTRNFSKMMAYLDTYVPIEISDSAMKETAFFKENLKEIM